MNTPASTNAVAVSRPKVTLLMILCGIAGAASMGAVSAATIEDGAPQAVIQYDPATLSNDVGAVVLYRRIVKAAAQVCPIEDGRDLHRAALARTCREQAIARAVHQINNPRLAEVYAGHSKKV